MIKLKNILEFNKVLEEFYSLNFEYELKDINNQYADITKELLNDDVNIIIRKLDENEFYDLFNALEDKEIMFNGIIIDSLEYLKLIAINFVK